MECIPVGSLEEQFAIVQKMSMMQRTHNALAKDFETLAAIANENIKDSHRIKPLIRACIKEFFSLVEGESTSMKYKYHVVVGSFGKQENAKGLQSTLKSEGNQALVVVNEKGMYRVLIASYNDYNQAHVRIKQIANRFADAWVLVQK